jgi:hypothetical protein
MIYFNNYNVITSTMLKTMSYFYILILQSKKLTNSLNVSNKKILLIKNI